MRSGIITYLPPPGAIEVREVRRVLDRLGRALSEVRPIPGRDEVASETRGWLGPVGIMLLLVSSLPPIDLRPVAEVGILEPPVGAAGRCDLRGTPRAGPREVRELRLDAPTGANAVLLLIITKRYQSLEVDNGR